jgi:hypothetical protein
VEGLDLGALLWLRLADGRRLALRDGLARGRERVGSGRNGLAGVDIVDGGEAAGEDCWSDGCDVLLVRGMYLLLTFEECIPVRLRARRLNARVQAMVVVCGVQSVGCLGRSICCAHRSRGLVAGQSHARRNQRTGRDIPAVQVPTRHDHHRRERQHRTLTSRRKFRLFSPSWRSSCFQKLDCTVTLP